MKSLVITILVTNLTAVVHGKATIMRSAADCIGRCVGNGNQQEFCVSSSFEKGYCCDDRDGCEGLVKASAFMCSSDVDSSL